VLIGLRPTAAAAIAFLVLGGAGRVVVDVAGRTLLQRLAPTNLLARVFGLLEGLTMAGLALGSLLAPALVAVGGAQLALLGVGALLPLAALVAGRSLQHVDRKADVPVVEIGLLRALPLFAPLDAPALESLARALEPVEVAAGRAVVTEGEVGDRFYLVADGRVEARRAGSVLSVLERGSGFGEIALLHDVPRTATCVATEASHLYALERQDFLEAVTGHSAVSDAAHRLAAERMSAAG
jgi:MFS family permease